MKELIIKNRQLLLVLPVLVLPGLLLLILFFVVPMLQMLRFSFLKYDQTQIYLPIITLENYLKFFSDLYFFKIMWNSLKIGIITALVSLIIGYPIAYYLAIIKGIERTIISAICLLPIFVTILVTTLGWYILLLPHGVTQIFLSELGIIKGSLNWLKTYPTLIAVLAHTFIPYVILILASSIQNLSIEKINAAKILGASTYQIFRKIIIPLTMPAIVSSGILVFALAISAYLVPILITGQKLRFLPMEVFSYTYELLNWPFASVIAMVLLALVAIGSYVFIVVTNKMMRRGQWEEA